MKAALNALDRQLIPNYAAIAKEYDLERTTVMRRHIGRTTSRATTTSLFYKLLTNT